jgi:N-methylhydantoinase B
MSTDDSQLVDGLPRARDPSFWDGVQQCYIPGPELRFDPSLRLHRSPAREIDPVTYELVRYSLLNINLEHTALLQKLAVSQLVILSRDYQSAMLTEDGEVLLVGPCIQFFAKSAGLAAQYSLEHRSGNPGIGPGDIFFSNDCFIGASHQMDASLLAPVFIGDELFCWVTNTLHYQDLGGESVGSWCHNAVDPWHEPLHWPPVKIVEAFEVRDDVERLFARQSRFPVTVGMDLRAAIAAIEFVREKVTELVDRYGADLVKGVMRSIQDAGERLFTQRLRSIPDGRWSHRFYFEGAVPGDEDLYTMQVNLTKVDDRLIVDNCGTDPQAGAISMTFAGFAGAALAGIVGQIVPDVAGAYGGPYRRIEFRPEPGTLLCASYPAAVSIAVFAMRMTLNATAIAVSKMLSCGDAETRARALGPSWPQPGGTAFVNGIDSDGEPWHGRFSEVMLCSFGGSPTRDGLDFGGHWSMPGSIGPNVEELEEDSPVVYLYRRGLPAGLDGAGRHRGGLGIIYGICLQADGVIQFATGESFPAGAGVLGSEPGSRARVVVVHASDALEQMKASHIPRESAELSGDRRELPWRAVSYEVQAGDVIEGVFPTVAGYGDPLRRLPEAVLADVQSRILDPDVAGRVYGVVIARNAIDREATLERRRAARRDRLAGREPGEPISAPQGAIPVGELLHVVNGRWWCNGADLGSSDANYKDKAIMFETPFGDLGDEFTTPCKAVADKAVFREFVCPVTGYRIDTEISLRTQAPLHEIRMSCDASALLSSAERR